MVYCPVAMTPNLLWTDDDGGWHQQPFYPRLLESHHTWPVTHFTFDCQIEKKNRHTIKYSTCWLLLSSCASPLCSGSEWDNTRQVKKIETIFNGAHSHAETNKVMECTIGQSEIENDYHNWIVTITITSSFSLPTQLTLILPLVVSRTHSGN